MTKVYFVVSIFAILISDVAHSEPSTFRIQPDAGNPEENSSTDITQPKFWGDIHYGMSPEDVAQALNKTDPSLSASVEVYGKGRYWRSVGLENKKYVKPLNIKFFGQLWRVQFEFKEDRLLKMSLTSADRSICNSIQFINMRNILAEALRIYPNQTDISPGNVTINNDKTKFTIIIRRMDASWIARERAENGQPKFTGNGPVDNLLLKHYSNNLALATGDRIRDCPADGGDGAEIEIKYSSLEDWNREHNEIMRERSERLAREKAQAEEREKQLKNDARQF